MSVPGRNSHRRPRGCPTKARRTPSQTSRSPRRPKPRHHRLTWRMRTWAACRQPAVPRGKTTRVMRTGVGSQVVRAALRQWQVALPPQLWTRMNGVASSPQHLPPPLPPPPQLLQPQGPAHPRMMTWLVLPLATLRTSRTTGVGSMGSLGVLPLHPRRQLQRYQLLKALLGVLTRSRPWMLVMIPSPVAMSRMTQNGEALMLLQHCSLSLRLRQLRPLATHRLTVATPVQPSTRLCRVLWPRQLSLATWPPARPLVMASLTTVSPAQLCPQRPPQRWWLPRQHPWTTTRSHL